MPSLELRMKSLPFDEVRLKKESCWDGSIKIVLSVSEETNDELSLECIDKRYDSNGAVYSQPKRKTSRAISRKDIVQLVEILEECRLSPLPCGIDGCDGEIWTFTIMSGLNRAQFRWWVEVPEEWKPLQDCADFLMRLCSQKI